MYNEGIKVRDFWSEPKNVESVFKLLAFSTGSGALVRLIAGNGYIFPQPETWRGLVGYSVGLFLIMLQFRFADGALLDAYVKHRKEIGKPASGARYWIIASFVVSVGMFWPAYAMLKATVPSGSDSIQTCK